MPGESYTFNCNCTVAPGTTPPDLAPYVVSVNNLQGILTIAADGGVSVRTEGNTLFIGSDGESGLGTVTSVNASSSNSNLTVTGGPITTTGTFTFNLAGALASISGLVTLADRMIYTTASDTYAVTPLTAYARTLLDDANSAAAQSTLSLVPGTDVQAWSQLLTDFIANSNYTGIDLELGGSLQVGSALVVGTTIDVVGDANFQGAVVIGSGGLTVAGVVTGDGSGLTNINAEGIDTGILDVARGGTNIGSYAVGDLIQATGATTLSSLASVSAGSYLRSGGVTTASVWSTLKLPNSSTAGDLFISTSANTMGSLADVAVNNVLLSGGVGVAPAYGKVTSSHTDGSTIATITAGANSNITQLQSAISYSDTQTYNASVILSAELFDVTVSSGATGDLLTSTSTGVQWSSQITLDTLTINTNLGIEGTITGAGTTGAQTINKPSGTVRFAAAATSLVVTNSLCTTSHRVLACVCTNDATAYVKNVVTTTGSFTITLGAAATAETECFFQLIQVT